MADRRSASPPGPEAWVREARLAEAADARSRRARWDRLGAEEATRSTILEGLARAGHGVRLDLGPAGAHHGSVTELGPDHVHLVAHGRWRYLRLSSVDVVTAAGDHVGPTPTRVDRSFEDVLGRLAGTWVTLVLASGAQHTGRVAAVAEEVLTLEGDPPAEPAYVSSSAVVAVLGDGSG
jgi:hypothetical protein